MNSREGAFGSVRRALAALPPTARKRFVFASIIQVALNLLDLIGLGLIAAIAALAAHGFNATKPGPQAERVLNILHLTHFSLLQQSLILGGIAIVLFAGKTIVSIVLLQRILKYLSHRGAELSTNLVSKLLNSPLLEVQESNSQESLFMVTSGVNFVVNGILGSCISLIADLSLAVLVIVSVFALDSFVAIFSFLIFGGLFSAFYFAMRRKVKHVGAEITNLSIESNQKVLEVIGSFRETTVRNRKTKYLDDITILRWKLADLFAFQSLMPNIMKYIVDLALILGAFLVALIQFLFLNPAHAIASLTIFVAAGTRFAPALLRVQQNMLTMNSNAGIAEKTLDFIEKSKDWEEMNSVIPKFSTRHDSFVPKLLVSNLSYSYPPKEKITLEGVNLSVEPGELIAFVGASGAGKSTLVDLLLGIHSPDLGEIFVSNMKPAEAISKWPGAVGYVPQDVFIAPGDIRSNVTLGFDADEISDEDVWEALRFAHLEDFVKSLSNGLFTKIGESGSNLSGGQRQRLGIARALITRPKLLIMDEATSALDSDSEFHISQSIAGLQGQITVILIAHRLSTVRQANQVILLAEGRITARGTFGEVRQLSSDFDRTAKLMGL